MFTYIKFTKYIFYNTEKGQLMNHISFHRHHLGRCDTLWVKYDNCQENLCSFKVLFFPHHNFFPVPLRPPFILPLVLFAPRPRRLLSNTDRAVTMAISTPQSLSSPELLLLLLRTL